MFEMVAHLDIQQPLLFALIILDSFENVARKVNIRSRWSRFEYSKSLIYIAYWKSYLVIICAKSHEIYP